MSMFNDFECGPNRTNPCVGNHVNSTFPDNAILSRTVATTVPDPLVVTLSTVFLHCGPHEHLLVLLAFQRSAQHLCE